MIKIVRTGGDGYGMYHREYIMSSTSDASDLPNSQTPAPKTAEAGSVAHTQDLKHKYPLGPDGVWREV